MLKRLELIGFKSFADKTRFDFPAGITAVVGPNGSGKSNIVDAVRWILGEQSAKSLRGGEMADVIFNGSASRKSLGMAEVTMTFDNSQRHLALDAEEVQITRRVYRDGTGEYLINQQMSRLKDIKEMFLGSGAGHGAYSIIEQGRVDALLQASTKDRRAIFEEAAGISRFKARKIETLRKLENVDQNLSRVRDIIVEVEKQLRRVRLEASKAQRFQEYSTRLRELRIGLGLREYGQFSERLTVETAALADLRSRLGEAQIQAAASESEARQLEMALTETETVLELSASRLADARQHIAAQEAHLESEAAKAEDLDRQLAETSRRRLELIRHVQVAAASAADAQAELHDAESQAESQRRRVAELDQALAVVDAELTTLRRQVQDDRIAQVDRVRQAGTLQTQADSAKQQLERYHREREQRRRRAEQKAAELSTLERVLEDLDRTEADLQHRIGLVRSSLVQRQQERDDLRKRAESRQQELADLHVRRSDLRGRIDVLEALERSQEGLGEGVRELTALLSAERDSQSTASLARSAPQPALPPPQSRGEGEAGVLVVAEGEDVTYPPPDFAAGGQGALVFADGENVTYPPGFAGGGQGAGRLSDSPSPESSYLSAASLSSTIVGFVAEFLNVPREVAPLIDLALGDKAQQFIVRDSAQLDRLLALRDKPFAGRVSFLQLVPMEPLSEGDETSTADRWVTCDHPDLQGLPRQLLGNVRIVPDLATARGMAADEEFRGYRFITRQGELLDTDGTLTVGTHHAEAGILSRKSELRDLRAQAAGLENDVQSAEQAIAMLKQQIDTLEAPIHGLVQEIELLSNQAGDLQSQVVQHRQNRARIDDEIVLFRAEMNMLEDDIDAGEKAWKDYSSRAEEAEHEAQALKTRLEENDRRIRKLEADRLEGQDHRTTAQVALAQMEERLAGLRARFERFETDLNRGRDESYRVERHASVLEARHTECQLARLHAAADLASLHLLKERSEFEIADATEHRERDRERRRVLVEQLQTVRAASQEQLNQLHQCELSVHDLQNGRQSLVERIREEYQVDLAEVSSSEATVSSSESAVSSSEFLVSSSATAEAEPQNTSEVQSVETRDSKLETRNSEEVNAEIGQLREKIRKLGNVSLEALQELQEVETRARDLQAQHDDLMSAQGSLMEIISKINTDSRKLFIATYDTIRTHFQELFRKLFGGGMADIVLENPDDVLESGIEIVARPPGKELRSISLLSGGEKTLTAIAMLFAIFRSKPSPFCLLDEIDAALDEANNTRLAALLREFLDRSQFIVITHKKRTMAAADVLYGITMQESGVSKQVAVRFEDWPEEEAELQQGAA
jgi:chromosome segregation protein